ncbi:MAG TPA: dihydrolipoamide acetyltransferase family protein [Steroidobacteraceae bacterium]|nr:dihydrolipoamide acetyltransferase family protein [Steroidobacteraceae bacterium]
MPQLGETVTEGTLISWSRAIGDSVQPGDVLCEIETEKTSMEIPATSAGVITEIRVSGGEVVAVGTVLAVIRERTDGAPALPTAVPVAAAAAPTDPFREVHTPAIHYGPGRLPSGTEITPRARRLAGQDRIDVGQLSGSGPRGRIVGRDVEAHSARSPAVGGMAGVYAHTPHEVVALGSMRRQIAQRLVAATQTIPHFYLSIDVAVDALQGLRTSFNAAAPAAVGGAPASRLSLNDFVIKALGTALMHVPEANAIWAEDRLLRFHQADIGVAVAIEGGLITPVLRHVEAKSLVALSMEIRALAQRARARRLLPPEYQGGSISVSNLGMYGVAEFSAIINPPQAAILAVGAASRVAVETAGGGVRFESRMRVTLSCDHRVIDGALGARLLAALREAMEAPAGLLA